MTTEKQSPSYCSIHRRTRRRATVARRAVDARRRPRRSNAMRTFSPRDARSRRSRRANRARMRIFAHRCLNTWAQPQRLRRRRRHTRARTRRDVDDDDDDDEDDDHGHGPARGARTAPRRGGAGGGATMPRRRRCGAATSRGGAQHAGWRGRRRAGVAARGVSLGV